MKLKNILKKAKEKAGQYPAESLLLAKQGLGQAVLEKNSDMEALAYTIMANSNLKMRNHKETLGNCERALEIVRNHGISDRRLEIDIKRYFAEGLSFINRIDETATVKINEALGIANELGDEIEVYRCLVTLGTVHRRKGEYYQALQSYKRAKELQEQASSNKSDMAIISLNIANIFYILQNYEIALDYYKEALRYLEGEDSPRQKSLIKYNIYITLLELKDYDKDEFEYGLKVLINEFERQGIRSMKAYALTCLGKFYLYNDELEKADECAMNAIAYCKHKIDIPEVNIVSYEILFEKSIKTNSLNQAMYYGELILELWKEVNNNIFNIAMDVGEKLLLVYKQKEENEKGFQLALFLSELRKKMTNYREAFQIDKIKMEMEMEQKKREIAHVNSINKIEKRNNEQLKDLNRELENFVGIASHDLKAPIRSILGFGRILEQKYVPQSSAGWEYLNMIIKSGEQMNELLDNLLSYAKAGRYKERPKAVSLNDVLTLVQINLDKLISEKKALIELGELPILNTHFSAMSQLFQNLLANALNYSNNDVIPKLSIMTCKIDNTLYVHVKDNGIGIAPEKTETIFEPFIRGEGRLFSSGTGLGLGLATCKKIMEYYGGTISVESSLGKGSTFILAFPINLAVISAV